MSTRICTGLANRFNRIFGRWTLGTCGALMLTFGTQAEGQTKPGELGSEPEEPRWGYSVTELRSQGGDMLPEASASELQPAHGIVESAVAGTPCQLPDDPYEDNDTPDTATNLGNLVGFEQNNLTLTPNDEDWYRFEACANTRYRIHVVFGVGSSGQRRFQLLAFPSMDQIVNLDGELSEVLSTPGLIGGEEYILRLSTTQCATYRFEISAAFECEDADIENDPGRCSAVYDFEGALSEACGFTCDTPSGSSFPVGQTPVSCTGNDPDRCHRHRITHSLSDEVFFPNSVSCNIPGGAHTENHYWRSFQLPSLGIGGDFLIDSVDIGIEIALSPAGVQPLFLNVYTNSGGPFPAGTRSLIGSNAFAVPDQMQTIVRLPVAAVAPAGSELVVEIVTPDGRPQGNRFFIGTNPLGQTAPSFISAADCGAPNPVDFAILGFPGVQYVMYVNGCVSRECDFTVTVNDAEPPQILCSPDQVVRCRTPDGASIDEVVLTVAASDNCGMVTVSPGDAPSFFEPTCSGAAPTRIRFTATDSAGLTADCDTNVVVTGATCCPAASDAELALLPAIIDLRQDNDGPTLTKAKFDIWNQNEIRFSGTERCVNCWDQHPLSLYGPPNHFLMRNLHTDKGRARIDGIDSPTVCDTAGTPSVSAPLLGVLIKQITFDGLATQIVRSATTLPGDGRQAGLIRFDRSGGLTLPVVPPFAELGPASEMMPMPEPGDSEFPIGALPDFQPDFENSVGRDLKSPLVGTQVGGQAGFEDFNDLPAVAGVGGGNPDATTSEKGSVLIFPSVEVKWNNRGVVIQDTFIELTNDNASPVRVQLYFVQGDPPAAARFVGDPPILIDRAHEGWNWVDAQILLTANQPTYWSVLTGQPVGMQPWTILDPAPPRNSPGRPDPDPRNRGGSMIRGFILAWAVNASGDEINWNHLSGSATVIHYAWASAWDYNPWAFQCLSTAATGALCRTTAGGLNLDGVEYDAAPDRLLMDFYTVGSQALSHPGVR